MPTLLAAGALAFAGSFAYGYACRLLPPGRRHWLTLTVVTLGLSLGGLTLVMFWIAWLFPGRFSPSLASLVCAALGAFGLYLTRGTWRPDPHPPTGRWLSEHRNPLVVALLTVVGAVTAGILFNAAYWPFSDADALAIYAPLGRRLFETRALPTGNLYEGYPMLVPLAYAFTHWAAGGLHESWARLVPALMAIGAVGTSAALGREIRSWRVGLMAAGLVVLTPVFGRWASSGYVDVPTSFFFGLFGLGAWRWIHSGTREDALLAGLAAGLGMWTKSAALTLWISLAALAILAAAVAPSRPAGVRRRPAAWTRAGWIAAGILATAGPWYARNVAVLGFFIPNTAWTGLARHDLAASLVMLNPGDHFLLPGWLYMASLLYAGIRIRLDGVRRAASWVTLLACVAPFLAAWWWLASYDSRFLVMLIPSLAVMAALMIEDARGVLRARLSLQHAQVGVWLGALTVLAMAPFALQKTVEGKLAIAEDPAMTTAERHRVLLGGAYDLALAINQLPEGSRVLGVPVPAVYHLDSAHLEWVTTATSVEPPWGLAPAYDFVVYNFQDGREPGWARTVEPVFQTADGYHMYATVRGGPAMPLLPPPVARRGSPDWGLR